MHINDYVHLDIHRNNIIITEDDSKLKPYFIDFQYSTEIKNFINTLYNNSQNLLDTIQMYKPLEIRLLAKELLLITNEKEYNKYIDIICNNILNYKYTWVDGIKNKILSNVSYKVFFNNKNTFLLSNSEKFCKEILEQVKPLFLKPDIIKWKESIKDSKNIILEKNTPIYKLYSELLKKVDVYSMGMFLIKIYFYYIGQKEVKFKPGKKPYIILNRDNKISVKLDTSSINTQFLDDLYTNLTKPFTIFIGKVINFNFKTRLTSGELIVEYKKLLPAFKKYISDPEFEKLYKLR